MRAMWMAVPRCRIRGCCVLWTGADGNPIVPECLARQMPVKSSDRDKETRADAVGQARPSKIGCPAGTCV